MQTRIRLKQVLFLTFTLIASLPVLILAVWVQQSALDKEKAAVVEKHLLVAHNLTGDLARYIMDIESSFRLISKNLINDKEIEGVDEHLDSLYLRYIAVIDSEGHVSKHVNAKSTSNTNLDQAKTLHLLFPVMEQARAEPEKIHYSNMVRTGENETTFYLVQAISNNQYVIGALSTTHIQQAQKKVTFGRRGHAAIVDRTGRAIAHPIPGWVKTMKDMSFLPPVAEMKLGKTGVSQFYTPAMQADMVAGYTVVPGVGWGVMIPQPFEELEERANDVQLIALTIALMGIAIAGLISWYIAGLLSDPIQSVVDATLIGSDDDNTNIVSEVSTSYRFIPHELRELLNSFNLMRNRINIMTSQLHSKINLANEEVKNQNLQLKHYSNQLLEANDKLGVEVVERRKAQEESALQSRRLRALYNASQLQDLSHDEKILSVLKLGCEFFNTEIGRVCEIDQARNISTIKYVIAPGSKELRSGKVSDLDKTFCIIPYTREDVVSISNISTSEWKKEACAIHANVDAYLATVIWVNGKKYGTISFSNISPRHAPFTESDVDFIKIMAQWVGVAMERRISVERENARSAAEAASEAKGSFLANMSHELRTPINAILGYGEILIEDCEELGNAQMKQDLERIRIAGTHLTKLISNILDLSKIEAGKVDVNHEAIDIGLLVNEMVDTTRPLVEKNSNDYIIDVGENVADIYSDATIIRQILLNLIGNAAKFTKNGLIRLSVSNVIENGVESVLFSVSDTGIGMTEDQLKIVFNEFSQANSTTRSEYGGIGLGLSISKRYCELLQGHIGVTSTLNKGTEFNFVLPRYLREMAVS